MSKTSTGLVIGLVVCLALPAVLIAGNNAIDQPEPDRDTGLIMYATVLFFVLAGAALMWILPGAPQPIQALWLLLGVAGGALLASIMEDYPYTFVELSMIFGIGAAIAVLAVWLSSEQGDTHARVIATTMGFALFVAAAYHVATIDQQVAMSAEAHRNTPGFGLLLLGAGLLAAAGKKRR